MFSKFFTILLILSILLFSPNLITLANNPKLETNNNSKLNQINIINFENPIEISQIDKYLQENNLTNLASISLLSNIQIGNYILSVPLEYDVNVNNPQTKNLEKKYKIFINSK